MLRDTLKVLMVEDRAEDAELLVREMRSRGLKVASRRVETSNDFEEALETFQPDLILSDYTLPGFHGTEALEIALRKRPVEPERIDELVSKIVRELESQGESEITSETIGQMLLVKDALPKGARLGPWSRPAGA